MPIIGTPSILRPHPSPLSHGAFATRQVREHPELSVGSQTEGIDVRSVGNSLVLKETALIEAFNLKAAIEFQMKNFEAAQEALSDMPPRAEEEVRRAQAATLRAGRMANLQAATLWTGGMAGGAVNLHGATPSGRGLEGGPCRGHVVRPESMRSRLASATSR